MAYQQHSSHSIQHLLVFSGIRYPLVPPMRSKVTSADEVALMLLVEVSFLTKRKVPPTQFMEAGRAIMRLMRDDDFRCSISLIVLRLLSFFPTSGSLVCRDGRFFHTSSRLGTTISFIFTTMFCHVSDTTVICWHRVIFNALFILFLFSCFLHWGSQYPGVNLCREQSFRRSTFQVGTKGSYHSFFWPAFEFGVYFFWKFPFSFREAERVSAASEPSISNHII